MDEIIKLILFFVKAESVAMLVYIIGMLMDTFMGDDAKETLQLKTDIDLFRGLTFLAILATFIYAWTI